MQRTLIQVMNNNNISFCDISDSHGCEHDHLTSTSLYCTAGSGYVYVCIELGILYKPVAYGYGSRAVILVMGLNGNLDLLRDLNFSRLVDFDGGLLGCRAV
jgi:hypothetical protein